ncbi:MAG: GNAT family N-acetyltransferase [Verrucomicrobia bacterium]|nr:GNAT family N-acetyltransferase [Verrucomicrobiota bacterium]
MKQMVVLETERLILRPWKPEDLDPFAKMCADPRVMEFFPALKSREECASGIKSVMEDFEQYGWGLWAAALAKSGEFIGFIGILHVPFEAPFTPAVEIGWRLAYDHWGKGYATEGALASLKYGFEVVGLEEIVSFTPTQNLRSRAVMEKIGMKRDLEGDFDHPRVPDGSPLKRHVLYRKKAPRS